MELSPNFQKLMGMVEGLKTLPESAAGHLQKPVDDFGYKPTAAETQRDIELDKLIAPIQREEFMKKREAYLKSIEEQNFKMPSTDELSSLDHGTLLELRRKATTKEQQNKLAPYEHRAWAREYIKDNPEAALVIPGMILAYNLAKETDLMAGRSESGTKAIVEGMKGWLEGIGGATKEGLDSLLENYEELKKELTWTPFPSGENVWEAGKKNGQKIKEKVE